MRMRGASSRSKRSTRECMPCRRRKSSVHARCSDWLQVGRVTESRWSQSSCHFSRFPRSVGPGAEAMLWLARVRSSSSSFRSASAQEPACATSPEGQKICGMIELRPTVMSQAARSQNAAAPTYHPAFRRLPVFSKDCPSRTSSRCLDGPCQLRGPACTLIRTR